MIGPRLLVRRTARIGVRSLWWNGIQGDFSRFWLHLKNRTSNYSVPVPADAAHRYYDKLIREEKA